MSLTVVVGLFFSLIALITASGNLIVLLAFYVDNKLRTINDYFIMNMAIADFLVGSFCIPFYIPFSLTRSWPFGSFFCQIWVTVDDVSTMASVINIVAITINRYWSIAYPLSYRRYARQHLVYLIMGAVWILSFLNFAPGIWLFRWSEGKEKKGNECLGAYNDSFLYMFIAQLNYFIWPFFVLCLLNLLILLNIWKRTRKLTRLRSFPSSLSFRVVSSPPPSSRLTPLHLHLHPSSPVEVDKDKSSPSTLSHFTSIADPLSTRINRSSDHLSRVRSRSVRIPVDGLSIVRLETLVVSPVRLELNSSKRCRTDFRIGRDRRAARSLFILVLIFLIFLFPYVICSLAATAGLPISPLLLEISFWLLWLNSTCNPFLYPFIQVKYRRAYSKLFHSSRRYLCSFSGNTTID